MSLIWLFGFHNLCSVALFICLHWTTNETEDIDFCLCRFLSSLLSVLQQKKLCIFSFVPAIMDLMFPLKPHSVILKAPLFSSLSLPLPLRFRAVTASKHVNIQCELDGRPNGALSGDFDPRFIDRVCLILLLLLLVTNTFAFLGSGYISFTKASLSLLKWVLPLCSCWYFYL